MPLGGNYSASDDMTLDKLDKLHGDAVNENWEPQDLSTLKGMPLLNSEVASHTRLKAFRKSSQRDSKSCDDILKLFDDFI